MRELIQKQDCCKRSEYHQDRTAVYQLYQVMTKQRKRKKPRLSSLTGKRATHLFFAFCLQAKDWKQAPSILPQLLTACDSEHELADNRQEKT